jgi:phosphonate transport system ATP-binding protein
LTTAGFILDNLSIQLGVGHESRLAIDDVTLTFSEGEQVAIIGPSGAGKTTLLHTLAIAHRPANGSVSMFNVDPWQCSDVERHRLRARVVLAPQAPPLPPRQRVVNAVLAGRLPQMSTWQALRSLVYPIDARAAARALERFSLGDKLTLRCDRLSGGERQRVGLTRMLLSNAPLILLDEPVSSLDPVLGASALETAQTEALDRGATLVVSLHDVNLARSHFTRLIGIRNGRVEFDTRADALRESQLVALYGPELLLAASDFALPESAELSPKLTRCY